ncbi:NAD(P)H-hydrate dehydratase [[Eubacterium] cellulosolvens]
MPNEYLTSSDIKRLDLNSDYLGISTIQLMENAGKSIVNEIISRFKQESRILILAGTGRNGGDGMVSARHLASLGYNVSTWLIGPESNIKDEAVKCNWQTIRRMKYSIDTKIITDSTQLENIDVDVAIDALLGLGFRGKLRQPILEAVRVLNKSKAFIISVDVPTGFDTDIGEADNEVVKANLTITFHKQKSGFTKGKNYLGEIKVASIGIPPEAEVYVGPGDVETCLRERSPYSKKGDFGRLLVIGGSEVYTGAPALVGLAALRAGADLVYIAAPEKTAEAISTISPNLITIKMSGRHFNQSNLAELESIIRKADAVALGPGMGLHKESSRATRSIIERLQELKKPTLIDADALKFLTTSIGKMDFPAILTPHTGEFESLTSRKVSNELENRILEVKKFAKQTNAIVLLKGRVDTISDGSRVRLNLTGNPGMTVGGTGDILSGIISSLMAQGCDPFESAIAGAFINGAAGDFAYEKKGFHLLSTDLLEEIPRIMIDPMSHRDVKLFGC